MDKPLFKEIKRKITYKALNLLLREWISAEKLVKELIASYEPPPTIEHDTCKKNVHFLYSMVYLASVFVSLFSERRGDIFYIDTSLFVF